MLLKAQNPKFKAQEKLQAANINSMPSDGALERGF
jgi:hypothetical protein